MYKFQFKRIIDFLFAFLVLLFIWPIFLLIIIWLHFSNKGSGVFFLQRRPGKKGKIFE
ncbi:sugar transferase, partial [Odoribacter laneus]|uniref:sugar transferase n=1 Tax=Odoribacter laneus TaxID=626933 RepID=UPI003FEEA32E